MNKKLLTTALSFFMLISLVANLSASATNITDSPIEEGVVTQGVCSYDSVTGIESYKEVSYNSFDSNMQLQSDSNIVLSVPEVVANIVDNNFSVNLYDDFMSVTEGDSFSTIENMGNGNASVTSLYGNEDNRWKVSVPSNVGMYRNICRIESRKDGETGYLLGTGFVISDTAIVTAGHCVYDYDKDEWYDSITITPAYANGSAPYGTVTGTSFECGSAWLSSGDANQDWGIIRVNNNFPSLCGSLGLRYQAASYVGTNVYVSGYPGKIGDNLENVINGRYMYADRNAVTWNSSSIISYTELDTSKGQSGAPAYLHYDDTGYTAIAIHRGQFNGLNSGVRLSQWLYNHLISFT